MCGIAGIFHYADATAKVDRRALVRMTRALAHRGPDAEGFHVDGNLGLGHRRLSIVDLTPTGAQPMLLDGGAHALSYNGELYNHREFRAQLETRGEVFRGTSDTETLLRLLAARGTACLDALAGIFAFAWWDRSARTLTLVRDPMGVKQLYVHDDGKRVAFASEIKALLTLADVPRALDGEALNQYLHFHTPLFERTFLRDVKVLKAGEFARYSAGGQSRRTYWCVDNFRPRGGTPEANVEELSHELSRIVGEQLMSDVPVGSFFSGGIDSTAVAAYAVRAGVRPRCFGVHFTGQGVIDERPFQESAAKALGLDLELITLTGETFPDDMSRLLWSQDQPVIGAAMIPMDAVAGLAAKKVKVCVGGQAADEVFGGYARYALTHPFRVASQWAQAPVRKALARKASRAPAGDDAPGAVGGNVWKQFAERRTLWRLAHNLQQNLTGLGDWQDRYFHHFAKVPEGMWTDLIDAPELVSRERCRALFRGTLAKSPATDPADKVMHWDAQTYLTGLFQQDDRMSMAHSLESRVPMADPRLVRFAFQSGFGLKFRDGASKWILRRAVADVIPERVLNRRKVGFDTPAERWMRGPHAGWVRDTLTGGRARARGLWDTKHLGQLLGDTDHPLWFDAVWKCLCVETWARQVLDGDGDRAHPVSDVEVPA
jgi:asparagine synthase (glutamine-hydrolysing)